MRFSGRLLGAFFLVLAAVGIAGCAAGVIALWVGRQAVAQRVEQIDARLAPAMQRASSATQDVQCALGKARADMGRVRTESAGLGADPVKDRRTVSILRKLIDRQIGPNISDVGGRLATFAEASVAAASVLRSVQDLPMGQASRIDPDSLERATEQVSRLSAALQKLQTTIGEDDKAANEREVAAAANDVDLVLQRCQMTVGEWQSHLDDVREEMAYVAAHASGWLTVAAIAGTVLCGWVGLGQISLCAHAVKWVRST